MDLKKNEFIGNKKFSEYLLTFEFFPNSFIALRRYFYAKSMGLIASISWFVFQIFFISRSTEILIESNLSWAMHVPYILKRLGQISANSV